MRWQLPDDLGKAAVSATMGLDGPASSWHLKMTGLQPGWSVREVAFPQVAVGPIGASADDDCLLLPQGSARNHDRENKNRRNAAQGAARRISRSKLRWADHGCHASLIMMQKSGAAFKGVEFQKFAPKCRAAGAQRVRSVIEIVRSAFRPRFSPDDFSSHHALSS